MLITAHTPLQISAERRFSASREVTESLTLSRGDTRIEKQRSSRVEVSGHSQSSLQLSADTPMLGRGELRALEKSLTPAPSAEASAPASHTLQADEESLHKLKMLLAALGRSMEDIDSRLKDLTQGWQLPTPQAAQETDASGVPVAPSGDFLDYHYSATHWQGESLAVSLQGSLETQDGRRIEYGLSLNMLQMSMSHESVSVRAGAVLTDPLVLNFAANGAALNGAARMSFDLNADGKTESLATLASDSAFLALDRNNNGRIDDGRELFGALTGDGFQELSAFDDDGNGFIDEGDAIFSQLKLWRPDAQGKGELVNLLTAGVGAIGLGRAYGDFSLVSNARLEGMVRSTGFYLSESGEARSIQQIDIAT